jgi:excisionase family DNA binding protein
VTNRVVIPFGSEILVLTEQEFAQALERGRAIVPQEPHEPTAAVSPEGLVGASEIASALNLAKSAVYEHARSGRFPCVRIGRHVRFSRTAVLEVVRRRGDEMSAG